MSEDLRIVHVLRPPLPWRRSQPRTECGLTTEVGSDHVETREQFKARLKLEGDRRARFSTCQTCLDTAQRWPSWDEDPAKCLERELPRWGQKQPVDVRQELRAVAMIVERHREEFDELVADMEAVVPLQAGRDRRRQ